MGQKMVIKETGGNKEPIMQQADPKGKIIAIICHPLVSSFISEGRVGMTVWLMVT